MKVSPENTFLRKPALLLAYIHSKEQKGEKVYCRMLRESGFSDVYKLLKIFKKNLGLVRFKRVGTRKYVSLTNDGKFIADDLITILGGLDRI